MRRKRRGYFKQVDTGPGPIEISVKCRAMFSQVDSMGVVWFGRYIEFFEHGSLAMAKRCGFSYEKLVKQGLVAPVVQCHIDYIKPIFLDMEFTVRARMYWSESASIKIEYDLVDNDSVLLARGYTVQLFVDAASGEHLLVSPQGIAEFREKWKNGELSLDE